MGSLRILSIDGGGIRGIIPAQILVQLEKLLKKYSGREDARISDYFDLIAGTSTGGILTAMYICPKAKGAITSRYSAEDAVELYLKNGQDIFYRPCISKIINPFGLFRDKYCCKNLENKLDQYFGDLKLSELLKPCLITAYNMKDNKTTFFNQMSARKNKKNDYFVKDVLRATSAAPSYFKMAKFKSISGVEIANIDGGVFANNPTLCAYAEASKIDKNLDASKIIILSLGTGIYNKPYNYKKIKNFGMIEWAIPLLHIIMSSIPETVDYQMKTIYNGIKMPDNYIRIQPDLRLYGNDVDKMDNVSSENLELLKRIGEDMGNIYYKKLDYLAKVLVNKS